MVKKASIFHDFVVATILADIFDPSGSDDIDYVSRKNIEGLDANGIIKIHEFDGQEGMVA